MPAKIADKNRWKLTLTSVLPPTLCLSQAYHIHFKSNLVVKRRYSEFLHLYEELMKIFTDFEYPKFPGKWPFQMSEVQLEKRRYLLETFIQKSKLLKNWQQF